MFHFLYHEDRSSDRLLSSTYDFMGWGNDWLSVLVEQRSKAAGIAMYYKQIIDTSFSINNNIYFLHEPVLGFFPNKSFVLCHISLF